MGELKKELGEKIKEVSAIDFSDSSAAEYTRALQRKKEFQII